MKYYNVGMYQVGTSSYPASCNNRGYTQLQCEKPCYIQTSTCATCSPGKIYIKYNSII